MQTSDEKGRRTSHAATAAPTLEERIGAVENFLQQLVVLLEVEPELTRENIAAWIALTNKCATAHGLQSESEHLATEQLCSRLLNFPFDIAQAAVPA